MAADMPPAPPVRKNTLARRSHGPTAIGALVPAVVRPAFRTQGAAVAQLMADWPAVVGHALALSTTPRRFAAGTLTLGCSGPVALELQHLSGPLLERINGHLGRAAVQRLRFVQEAPKRPETQVALRVQAAPVAVPDFPDGPLRDALAALGGAMQSDPP